jgi:hypothetical protein
MDPSAEEILMQALREQGIDLDDLSPEELASITETINNAVASSHHAAAGADDAETDDEDGMEAALVMLREGGEATYRDDLGGREVDGPTVDGQDQPSSQTDNRVEAEDEENEEEAYFDEEEQQQQEANVDAPSAISSANGHSNGEQLRPRRASYVGPEGRVDEEDEESQEDTSLPQPSPDTREQPQQQQSGDLDALPRSRKSLGSAAFSSLTATSPAAPLAVPPGAATIVAQPRVQRSPPPQRPQANAVVSTPPQAAAPSAGSSASQQQQQQNDSGCELEGESVPVMMPVSPDQPPAGKIAAEMQPSTSAAAMKPPTGPFVSKDHAVTKSELRPGAPLIGSEDSNTYPSVADVFSRNSIGGSILPPPSKASLSPSSLKTRASGALLPVLPAPAASFNAVNTMSHGHQHAQHHPANTHYYPPPAAPVGSAGSNDGGDDENGDGYVLVLLSSLQANAAAVAEAEAELRTVVRER